MLKTYELTDRHFGWSGRRGRRPPRQSLDYLLDRALRSQGLVSLLDPAARRRGKPEMAARSRRGFGAGGWCRSRSRRAPGGRLDAPEPATVAAEVDPEAAHILSPFDPLVIQRGG